MRDLTSNTEIYGLGLNTMLLELFSMNYSHISLSIPIVFLQPSIYRTLAMHGSSKFEQEAHGP